MGPTTFGLLVNTVFLGLGEKCGNDAGQLESVWSLVPPRVHLARVEPDASKEIATTGTDHCVCEEEISHPFLRLFLHKCNFLPLHRLLPLRLFITQSHMKNRGLTTATTFLYA